MNSIRQLLGGNKVAQLGILRSTAQNVAQNLMSTLFQDTADFDQRSEPLTSMRRPADRMVKG